ncbi:MAG: YicC/YloC family endoribonuclease [Lachnospiraceae bacterium]
MVRSMTGFGRFELSRDNRKITVEMKSVNHRYLELGIRLPKKLNAFEGKIREVMKNYISRGKVDVFISYEESSQDKVSLEYNASLAAEYMDIFNTMAQQFGMSNDVSIGALARYPEVITAKEAEVDEDSLWLFIEEAVEEACRQFVATREKEGSNLAKDLIAKLDHLNELVDFIEGRSPQILAEYRTKIKQKVDELLADNTLDEARIATEVVMYSDKICVDEETVRLKSHIDHAKKCLSEAGGVGRKLDFIVQEMNREANTILSKANNLDISNAGIELKTDIEKVREQIQNIE